MDGVLIPVQHLSCDANGFFTSLQDIQVGKARESWVCPNPDCGYENYVGIDYCGLCGTSRYSGTKHNKIFSTDIFDKFN